MIVNHKYADHAFISLELIGKKNYSFFMIVKWLNQIEYGLHILDIIYTLDSDLVGWIQLILIWGKKFL